LTIVQNIKNARESELLFCAANGSFMQDSAFRLRFKRFLKREELDGKSYTFYYFRHTVCTSLMKQEIYIPTIKCIMGDNTTDFILKIYSHINRDDVKRASQKLFTSLGV